MRGRAAACRRRAACRPAARRRRAPVPGAGAAPPTAPVHAVDRLVEPRARDRLDEVVERGELERARRRRRRTRSRRRSPGAARSGAARARARARRAPACARRGTGRRTRRRRRRARRAPRPPTPRPRPAPTSGDRAQHAASGPRAPAARRRPPAARAPRSSRAHPGAELRQRHDHRRPRPVLHREPVALAERALQPAVDVAQPDAGPPPGERLGGPLGVDPLAVVATPAARRRPPGRAPRSTRCPPSGRDSTPWRTAFSTSGCSDSTGTTACSTSGSTWTRTRSRSPKRACSSRRYFSTYCSSSASVTYGRWRRERVADELGELDQQLARLLRARVDEGGDGGERVVDEVRGDLRAQRAQLGAREPLALRLELGQLDHRRHQRRRLGDDARLLQPQPSRPLVERDERPDPCAAHRERGDDRRAQRAARRAQAAAARRARAPRAARGRAASSASPARWWSAPGAVEREQRVPPASATASAPVSVAQRRRRRAAPSRASAPAADPAGSPSRRGPRAASPRRPDRARAAAGSAASRPPATRPGPSPTPPPGRRPRSAPPSPPSICRRRRERAPFVAPQPPFIDPLDP